MILEKGVKWLQDDSIICEVVEVYTQTERRGSRAIKTERVKVSRNGKIKEYDKNTLEKTLNRSLSFRISIKKL